MAQSTPISTGKKRVVKSGKFYIDLYKVMVHIHVMVSLRDVSTKVKQLCKKAGVTSMDVSAEACGYVITFPESDPSVFHIVLAQDDLDINTITHETDHLRNYVMDHIGVLEKNGNKENSANLNGYLNEMVFKFLNKNNIPIEY